jgi:hypothetical protein
MLSSDGVANEKQKYYKFKAASLSNGGRMFLKKSDPSGFLCGSHWD